jgi:hypothetical protein
MDHGVIAPEDRWRMAMDATALTVEQEKAARPGSDFMECCERLPGDDRHPCWPIHYGLAGERARPGWQ